VNEKRGQELSIGTLILIVLGIIVLVLLVLGFSMGWSNLFSKVGIFQGSDLSAMVTACKVAVSSQSKVSYCEFKSVKFDDGVKKINCEFGAVESSLGNDKLDGCPSDIIKYYKGEIKGQKLVTDEELAAAEVAKLDCAKYTEGTKNGEVIQGTCPNGRTDITNKVKVLPIGSKCCLVL